MSTLIYVYDPMCSWCYGFHPTWKAILQGLPDGVTVQTRLGGLAPDSNTPMSDAMRDKLAATWHRIESTCQVSFDHGYWDQRPNPPRSTYIAGRAVRAAQSMGLAEWNMVEAIQDAYYQARA
ncbi:MAG: DsbA family protein, partial [Pseudomonadales bacterium]